MQIIPQEFLNKIVLDKALYKVVLDFEDKLQNIISKQNPIFFPEYTDHGIDHFANTLKMAFHIIDFDPLKNVKEPKTITESLLQLDITVLVCATLLHDLGMHIHFKGFKQIINGYFDDVRVEFFDEFTWKKEWENFMIVAKRFSGRERINIFGDEQVIIKDIDFSKDSVDSDIQKLLIGEFIRRKHGRLAHEIALKGFPVAENEVIKIGDDLEEDYRDLIGLVARSHSMNVRDAMEYVAHKFPADPRFPYSIEMPFIMCVLRIADYFQFDKNRANAFLIKLKSFKSPFSEKEHKTHLSTKYFKPDDNDPETLFVHLNPIDGLMYNKLTSLFDDIQIELDVSFAILGEMYGIRKEYLKLRYRRIKTNLKNKTEISRLPYITGQHKFAADTDLFKLLVGPLYGYNPSYGVREVLQNAIDACIELKYKSDNSYEPLIEIHLNKSENGYQFLITDNGKGMNVEEIENYFLKAGSSFRNSTEWKIDYQSEENAPVIRRTGKFGIGVLASFLIGDSIEVKTRRFNEEDGFQFKADLKNEFIDILKNNTLNIGTTIKIDVSKETYDKFCKDKHSLTKWYLLKYPKINYFINNVIVDKEGLKIDLINDKQFLEDSVRLEIEDFDDIIWSYVDSSVNKLAINGIQVPSTYLNSNISDPFQLGSQDAIYDELRNFPFVSILDRNNLIDLELSRNAIRGKLPFIKELVESCKLDFLFKLLFFEPPVSQNILDFNSSKFEYYYYSGFILGIYGPQFDVKKVFTTNKGYYLHTSFYNKVVKNLVHYNIFASYKDIKKISMINNSTYSTTFIRNVSEERDIIRGGWGHQSHLTISTLKPFYDNNENKTIATSIRDSLKILEKNENYVLYQKGEGIMHNHIENLKEIFNTSGAIAVQITTNTAPPHESVNDLLKEHFLEPKLIPIDYDEKIEYIKTLSTELQTYLKEKRGIKL